MGDNLPNAPMGLISDANGIGKVPEHWGIDCGPWQSWMASEGPWDSSARVTGEDGAGPSEDLTLELPEFTWPLVGAYAVRWARRSAHRATRTGRTVARGDGVDLLEQSMDAVREATGVSPLANDSTWGLRADGGAVVQVWTAYGDHVIAIVEPA